MYEVCVRGSDSEDVLHIASGGGCCYSSEPGILLSYIPAGGAQFYPGIDVTSHVTLEFNCCAVFSASS
jgi:hypothetical protein